MVLHTASPIQTHLSQLALLCAMDQLPIQHSKLLGLSLILQNPPCAGLHSSNPEN